MNGFYHENGLGLGRGRGGLRRDHGGDGLDANGIGIGLRRDCVFGGEENSSGFVWRRRGGRIRTSWADLRFSVSKW